MFVPTEAFVVDALPSTDETRRTTQPLTPDFDFSPPLVGVHATYDGCIYREQAAAPALLSAPVVA